MASHPGVSINYQSIGSGGGIRQVTSGTIDFGASDTTMTDEQLAASKVKIQAIPTVLRA
jgi:phosphate transport system substrate-binding protein